MAGATKPPPRFIPSSSHFISSTPSPPLLHSIPSSPATSISSSPPLLHSIPTTLLLRRRRHGTGEAARIWQRRAVEVDPAARLRQGWCFYSGNDGAARARRPGSGRGG